MQGLSFETARGTVHAWQCDHMGHANLRAYGEFFEQALWHVFHRIGITPSVLRGETIRMAGVQQSINYRKELLPGDLVLVKSQLIEFRERSLKMRHEMQHVETGELCATCELTAVCIDARTRKPREFPPEISSKAKEIL
ncbi:MAG TPA: thioesterase family protein [Burkholderiales bacterium]|nr:thioesterase family protein [Burkholderiales bacterium]